MEKEEYKFTTPTGNSFKESDLKQVVLGYFKYLGYEILSGPEIAPGGTKSERTSYSDTLLPDRLHSALSRLNSHLPQEALEEAFRKISCIDAPSLIEKNNQFHKFVTEGVPVEFQIEGKLSFDYAKIFDFENPENNNFLVVDEFTIVENDNRRPDIISFVNGLPLSVIELKFQENEKGGIWPAFDQLQTYKAQIPSLFVTNEVLVISQGLNGKIGSLSSDWNRFKPWRTVSGEAKESGKVYSIEVLIKGVFEKSRFLDLINNFIIFEENNGRLNKKIGEYHQFSAANVALQKTISASASNGDKKIGIVSHTQGSGKSLTMFFLARKILFHPAMKNPTLVVLTDRNDLDGQLFGTFLRCHEVLRQTPVQAENRKQLRELLEVESGGVIFTTIQKFLTDHDSNVVSPEFSNRRNIVVIADEAHRTQYDEFARSMRTALPNASFIAFTGTPIALDGRNTEAVFGDYISVYDMRRAVEDGSTVPIYYDPRFAEIYLPAASKLHIDQEFEEVTEEEEKWIKEKLKSKWANLETIVGSDKRIKLLAKDIVDHFEKRLATKDIKVLDGKAMIVCMSRRICIELYNALVKLRPQWEDKDDTKGTLKVVMTGSASDPTEWQEHIRNKTRREKLANRFRDPADPFKIVIVRDMWLTGFDVPSLNTMYLDKPMQGHNLMQAITRVNRVFKDKHGGLIVDYFGCEPQLKSATAVYTDGKHESTVLNINEAIVELQKQYEICCGLLEDFNWSVWTSGEKTQQFDCIKNAVNFIYKNDREECFKTAVNLLSKAFELVNPNKEATRIIDDVRFFQTVKSHFFKDDDLYGENGEDDSWRVKTTEDTDQAIRQMASEAIETKGIIDRFLTNGVKKTAVSILSDEFLAEVLNTPQKYTAVEIVKKVLKGETERNIGQNKVRTKLFSEELEKTIAEYNKKNVDPDKILKKLVEIAQKIKDIHDDEEKLGLTKEEIGFYNTLDQDDIIARNLGAKGMCNIAKEIKEEIKKEIAKTLDWALRDKGEAAIRVKIKKVLANRLSTVKYPIEKINEIAEDILEQAKALWATD